MSYQYEELKEYTFSDEGQRSLIRARDFATDMIKKAGCVRCQEVLNSMVNGDSWERLSVVDRLVELGDLIEVKQAVPVAQQHRMFINRQS